GRHPEPPDAALVAPLLRHALARARGGPQGLADDARSRRHRHDAGLYAGLPGPSTPGLRPLPPSGRPRRACENRPVKTPAPECPVATPGFPSRMRRLTAPAGLAFLLCLAPAARAELIVFEDGHVVKAAGYEVLSDELEISLPGGGSYRVDLNRIERIVDDEVVVDTVIVEDDGAGPLALADLSSHADRKPLFATPYDALIDEEARRQNVDAAMVSALIRAESNYQPRAVSRKGARGLMQLMPATAKRLSVRKPFDPESNVRWGVPYLASLTHRSAHPPSPATTAYNARRGAVAAYAGFPA